MEVAMRRALALALTLLATPALAARASPVGVWRNASDSVRIRVAACGRGLCGTVVQASAKAKADAARGGTERLVGTRLFRDFRREDEGLWRGRVFVPDIAQSFDGTLELRGATLIGTGCLFGSLGCRSTRWTRVKGR
jgi:uncharacterized protein (DUF2147 family)